MADALPARRSPEPFGEFGPQFMCSGHERQFGWVTPVGADPALSQAAGSARRHGLCLQNDDTATPRREVPRHRTAHDAPSDDHVVDAFRHGAIVAGLRAYRQPR